MNIFEDQPHRPEGKYSKRPLYCWCRTLCPRGGSKKSKEGHQLILAILVSGQFIYDSFVMKSTREPEILYNKHIQS